MLLWRSSAVLLSGAVLVLGLSAGSAQAQQAQTVNVTLSEFKIDPNPITVRAGTPVHFVVQNAGRFGHDLHVEGQGASVEAAPGDSTIAGGQSTTFDFTFNTP